MDFKTKGIMLIAVILFLISTIFFFIAKPAFALKDSIIDEKKLGEICVNQTIPTVKLTAEDTDFSTNESDKAAKDDSKKKEKDESVFTKLFK